MDVRTHIKHYATPEECIDALRGMLEVKNEWLDYVKRREKELAL